MRITSRSPSLANTTLLLNTRRTSTSTPFSPLCDRLALDVDHLVPCLDVDAGLRRDGGEGGGVEHRHQRGGAVSSVLHFSKVDGNQRIAGIHALIGLDLDGKALAVHLHGVDADVHEHFHTVIGFDAGICHEALASKIKNTLNRLHLGKLTYVMIALRQLFYLEPFILDAALENGEHRSFENVLFAVAMNFPYEGGGFCFCPEADGTDDLLDVMVVSNLAKWKVSYLLPMALFGRHTGFPEVHMERCSSLSFQTDRAEPVHLDGESGGHRTEERIGLETERLRLLGDWVKEGMER